MYTHTCFKQSYNFSITQNYKSVKKLGLNKDNSLLKHDEIANMVIVLPVKYKTIKIKAIIIFRNCPQAKIITITLPAFYL